MSVEKKLNPYKPDIDEIKKELTQKVRDRQQEDVITSH